MFNYKIPEKTKSIGFEFETSSLKYIVSKKQTLAYCCFNGTSIWDLTSDNGNLEIVSNPIDRENYSENENSYSDQDICYIILSIEAFFDTILNYEYIPEHHCYPIENIIRQYNQKIKTLAANEFIAEMFLINQEFCKKPIIRKTEKIFIKPQMSLRFGLCDFSSYIQQNLEQLWLYAPPLVKKFVINFIQKHKELSLDAGFNLALFFHITLLSIARKYCFKTLKKEFIELLNIMSNEDEMFCLLIFINRVFFELNSNGLLLENFNNIDYRYNV